MRNVRVFDGKQTVAANSVRLRDETIEELGDGLQPHPADDAGEVLDGDGGTLLPGLIDAHTHLMSVTDLEQAVVFGVSTELDMFCAPSLLDPLRAAAAARDDVADVRSAGVGATVPGGHPTQLTRWGYPDFPTIDDPSQAQRFVAARIAEGSDYLKILIEDGGCFGVAQPAMTPELVTALVTAADARGLRTVAHISCAHDADMALAAGVDGLAHLFIDQPPDPEFGGRVAAAGAFATPTLSIFEGARDPGNRRETRYVDHPRLWPYLDPQLRAHHPGRWGEDWELDAASREEHAAWGPPAWTSPDHAHAATRLAHAAGAPVLAGTDVAFPRAAHGLSLHAELDALVGAGLPPAAALAAATSVPAEQFGLSDRGRIAPGTRADLLLVDGDPITDITATGEITAVWRRGQRLDREAHPGRLNKPT